MGGIPAVGLKQGTKPCQPGLESHAKSGGKSCLLRSLHPHWPPRWYKADLCPNSAVFIICYSGNPSQTHWNSYEPLNSLLGAGAVKC